MSKACLRRVLVVMFSLSLLAPALAQSVPCEGLVFSTEEDFLSGIGGVGVISDGDLLSRAFPGPGVHLCARNAELLAVFGTEVDLGLDAVQVIEPNEGLIAFSTELDDPEGRFRAGDLLGTNGAVIPNVALLARFDVPFRYDLGLDALQFEGERGRVIGFLERAADAGREAFLEDPELLVSLLEELDLELLFSTEGTGFSPQQPLFLDGDLLAVRAGAIAISNANLLPALPAGVPVRGADFGLDAFTFGFDPIENVSRNFFSTEIDSLEERLMFTDGDVLAQGAGIVFKNFQLIRGLEPPVRELGLDALDLVLDSPIEACQGQGEIVKINGFQKSLIDPVTGYARKTGGANPPPSPPAAAPFDRPFGNWLVLHGNLPGAECPNHEFRVEWQAGVGPWAALIAPAGWQTNTSTFCSSFGWGPYTSTGDGWISLAAYRASRHCHPDQALQVWNTSGRNGFHRLRVRVREIGNPVSEQVSAPVAVMLDNVAPNPVSLTLWNAACTAELSNQCEVTGPPTATSMYIKGQARDNGTGSEADGDEHFYAYSLFWAGDDVPDTPVPIPDSDRFYDGSNPDLGSAGTLPPGVEVPLGLFDLSAAYGAVKGGAPPKKCGYSVRLTASDRTIVGRGLNLSLNLNNGIQDGWTRSARQSFCYTPG